MMKFKFSVSTNKVGSTVTDTVELADGLSDDEIEEVYKEWMFENIDGNWSKIEDKEAARNE